MSASPTPARRGWAWDRWLLLALVTLAAMALLATPALIQPYPAQAAWFESPALFPRLALGLVVLGGLGEVWVRRLLRELKESEELDSSCANVRQAAGVLALFIAYVLLVPLLGYLVSSLLFLLACGALLRLGLARSLGLAVPLAVVLWAVFVLGLKVYFGHGWLV